MNEVGADMSILDHLEELRKRLFISIIVVLIGSVIAYYLSGISVELLSKPFKTGFKSQELIGTGPAEAFLFKLKLSIFVGLILSCPILFLQLWKFIEPGLLENEKKLALPFVLCTTGLFLAGVLFCYYIVFPLSLIHI